MGSEMCIRDRAVFDLLKDGEASDGEKARSGEKMGLMAFGAEYEKGSAASLSGLVQLPPNEGSSEWLLLPKDDVDEPEIDEHAERGRAI